MFLAGSTETSNVRTRVKFSHLLILVLELSAQLSRPEIVFVGARYKHVRI